MLSNFSGEKYLPQSAWFGNLFLFSHSVVSNSLGHHGLQHSRLPVLHISWNLLKLMSIDSVMPSNHLVLCCPLLLLPSIIPSIRVFSNQSALYIRWPKYWSFGFSISPSNEYSGMISFRIDWFDFLAVQGTQEFCPTPQFKTSILWHSTFFMVQLSHPFMITGKIITLTIWTKIRLIVFFVAKDGEALYSQQKEDQQLTVAHILNSLLTNSD